MEQMQMRGHLHTGRLGPADDDSCQSFNQTMKPRKMRGNGGKKDSEKR